MNEKNTKRLIKSEILKHKPKKSKFEYFKDYLSIVLSIAALAYTVIQTNIQNRALEKYENDNRSIMNVDGCKFISVVRTNTGIVNDEKYELNDYNEYAIEFSISNKGKNPVENWETEHVLFTTSNTEWCNNINGLIPFRYEDLKLDAIVQDSIKILEVCYPKSKLLKSSDFVTKVRRSQNYAIMDNTVTTYIPFGLKKNEIMFDVNNGGKFVGISLKYTDANTKEEHKRFFCFKILKNNFNTIGSFALVSNEMTNKMKETFFSKEEQLSKTLPIPKMNLFWKAKEDDYSIVNVETTTSNKNLKITNKGNVVILEAHEVSDFYNKYFAVLRFRKNNEVVTSDVLFSYDIKQYKKTDTIVYSFKTGDIIRE